MRIVFVCEYYPPFVPGGAEVSTELLAQGLERAGHRITVVTPNYGSAPMENRGGVSVYRFQHWGRLRPGVGQVGPIVNANPAFYALVAFHVYRTARKVGADVIHAHHPNVLPGAALAAFAVRRPLVFTLRDTSLLCPIGGGCLLVNATVPRDCSLRKLLRECLGKYYPLYGRPSPQPLLYRLLMPLRWVDICLKQAVMRRARVVGVSEGILNVYRAAGRISRNTGQPVYTSGPEVTGDGLPEDQRERLRVHHGIPHRHIVLYAGKRSFGKGMHVFVEAARRVRRERSDVAFLAVGKGELGGDPVKVLEAIPQEELFQLYALADLVVVPSLWPEPFSRVLLEASAHGTPCVATRVGGTPEAVVDGETGVLVPPGDSAALARVILSLLADDDRRRRLGSNARLHVRERFGLDVAVARILSVYAR